MSHILLFTEDEIIIDKINKLSTDLNCTITTARLLKDAIKYLYSNSVSLCVIDWQYHNTEIYSALKLINNNIPKIILSNCDSEETKFNAFENGCDDYILKSTSAKEMQFRFQSIIKRALNSFAPKPILNDGLNCIGNSIVDFQKRQLYSKQQVIKMSKKEADLLKLFCSSKGKLIKREDILKEIWDSSDYQASKSMDVYLCKLRKILGSEKSVSIQNIHGTGYMFIENDSNIEN